MTLPRPFRIFRAKSGYRPALRARLLPLLLLVAFLSGGCVTMKPSGSRPTSAAVVIDRMPVRTWGDNTCGAGALATVLNHFGDELSEEELIHSLRKGRNGGVLSLDVMLKARNEGFDASLVRGDQELVLKTLKNGLPVILMLQVVNLPGESKDLFHYIVVDGIDTRAGLVRTQFGDGKARWTSLDRLEGPWKSTEYATLLISPPSEETRAIELEVRKALAMEQAGNAAAAISAYREILERHPDRAAVWVNLGNSSSATGDLSAAESAYRKAISIDPDQRDGLNNLAWLLFRQDRLEEAESFARRAAALRGTDSDLIFDTLARILAARGNCGEAAEAYENALQSIPDARSDSRPSLLLRLGQSQAACGKIDEARLSFERGLAEGPDAATGTDLETALTSVRK